MAASKKRPLTAAEPRKLGRPSSYDPAYAKQAFKYALLGATDEEMASFFEISVPTFYAWQKQFPAFLKAIRRGKVEADATVAQSLYKRANGYSHPAVKILSTKDEGVVSVPYTEHYPPDTASAIFWLKNRQRGKWRDKQDIEHTGADGGPIQNSQTIAIADLQPEQREQLRALLLSTKRLAPPVVTDVEDEAEVDDTP